MQNNGEASGFRPDAVWLYSDGMYRWLYERDLHRNRFESKYVMRVMGLVFALSWGLMVTVLLVMGVGFDRGMMAFGIITAVCLGGWLITAGILRMIHMMSANAKGGVEVIGFLMNDEGLRQIHYEGVNSAEEVAQRLNLVPGDIRAVGNAEAMQPGGFGVTLFRDVRRVEPHPQDEVIDLTLKGNYKCRVYVRKDDFPFVRDYIAQRAQK